MPQIFEYNSCLRPVKPAFFSVLLKKFHFFFCLFFSKTTLVFFVMTLIKKKEVTMATTIAKKQNDNSVGFGSIIDSFFQDGLRRYFDNSLWDMRIEFRLWRSSCKRSGNGTTVSAGCNSPWMQKGGF